MRSSAVFSLQDSAIAGKRVFRSTLPHAWVRMHLSFRWHMSPQVLGAGILQGEEVGRLTSLALRGLQCKASEADFLFSGKGFWPNRARSSGKRRGAWTFAGISAQVPSRTSPGKFPGFWISSLAKASRSL